MKIAIETSIKTDKNKELETFTALFDTTELQRIIDTTGIDGANKAIDGFVGKYVLQLKQKLSAALSK
jgi:hypothetical protein